MDGPKYQVERRDEGGARRVKVGSRENGLDSQVRVAAMLRAAGGIAGGQDRIELADEGQSTAAGLRHDLKKGEDYLNTQLSALDSGSRDKDAAINDLQMKLAAAAATETTSMTKWDAERPSPARGASR